MEPAGVGPLCTQTEVLVAKAKQAAGQAGPGAEQDTHPLL